MPSTSVQERFRCIAKIWLVTSVEALLSFLFAYLLLCIACLFRHECPSHFHMPWVGFTLVSRALTNRARLKDFEGMVYALSRVMMNNAGHH